MRNCVPAGRQACQARGTSVATRSASEHGLRNAVLRNSSGLASLPTTVRSSTSSSAPATKSAVDGAPAQIIVTGSVDPGSLPTRRCTGSTMGAASEAIVFTCLHGIKKR